MNKNNPLENYELVKDRIPKFYSTYADGRCTTEIYSETNDHVTIKASLYACLEDQVKGAPLSTGYAKEERGGMIDKYTENCETSAIGRALANLNIYGALATETGTRPSREEMNTVRTQTVQTPRPDPKPAVREPTRATAPISDGSTQKLIRSDRNSKELAPIEVPASWNCIWGYCDKNDPTGREPHTGTNLVLTSQDAIKGGKARKENWNMDIVACRKPLDGIRPDGGTWCNYQCDIPTFLTNSEQGVEDWDNGSQYA